MIPRPTNRAPRSRVVRGNLHQPRLESLAAEFALLAQRRARSIHQIALLDQQRAAAYGGFVRLQHRIAWLLERMDAVNPELRAPLEAEPEPPPPPPPPAPRPASALAAIGRHWAAQPRPAGTRRP
jgi:hypothetical protein